MTAPKQLAKWREDANAVYLKDTNIDFFDTAKDHYIAGYLRRCQETEQIMKLAKFGAYLITSGYSEHDDEAAFGLREIGKPLYPNIETTIKDLLK